MPFKDDLAEKMFQRNRQEYRGRHSAQGSMEPELQQESDTTDFSLDRPLMQRFNYVVNHILTMVPKEYDKDPRISFFRAILRDVVKEVAMVPDDRLAAMSREAGSAFMFIADGDLDELLGRDMEEQLAKTPEEEGNDGT
jgi:hypothetical protein